MKQIEFSIQRCEPKPAIAFENANGYWKNIKGTMVGMENNLIYGGFRYIFKYEGDLCNALGVRVEDYKDKEMYLSPKDIKILDWRAGNSLIVLFHYENTHWHL